MSSCTSFNYFVLYLFIYLLLTWAERSEQLWASYSECALSCNTLGKSAPWETVWADMYKGDASINAEYITISFSLLSLYVGKTAEKVNSPLRLRSILAEIPFAPIDVVLLRGPSTGLNSPPGCFSNSCRVLWGDKNNHLYNHYFHFELNWECFLNNDLLMNVNWCSKREL